MIPPMDMKTFPLALLNDHIFLKTDALINGQWNAGDVRLDVLDPSTGRVTSLGFLKWGTSGCGQLASCCRPTKC